MLTVHPSGPAEHGWDWERVLAVSTTAARRVLGPGAAAEDAAQEATLTAWRSRHQCQTPDAPDAWVASIARREALKQVGPVTVDLAENLVPSVDSHEATSIATLDIHTRLFALAPDERHLLWSRYWADMTQVEIAANLGVPDATVRIRLLRLRARLRKTLEP